jgi:hypothetical protein
VLEELETSMAATAIEAGKSEDREVTRPGRDGAKPVG